MKKKLAATLSVVLILGLAVLGILAYLTSEDSDVNVMTLGNVKIEQHEYERVVQSDGTYEMITVTKADGATQESYKLQEFTQDKPLMPAVGDPNGGYTSKHARFEQLSDKASGGQAFLAGIKNAQDKIVLVENTGKSDAYVRTILAFELGTKTIDEWNDLIKTCFSGNNTEPWEVEGIDGVVTIEGNNYCVMEAVYTGYSYGNKRHNGGLLPAGEWTYNNLVEVYMSSAATNEDVTAFDGNKNGKYDILVLSQAVQAAGFADPQTALDTAFGEVTPANAAEWFDAIPEGFEVNNSEELAEAVEAGETEIWMNPGTYRASNAAQGKTLTLNGTKDVVLEVVPDGQGEAGGQLDYSFDGSNVTFNGITIKTNSQLYAGYARLSGTYNDCTIQNTYNLGTGNSAFYDCEINITNEYLRVGGASTAIFDGCTFNTDGRAILVFQDGTNVAQTVTVKDCTFNATAAANTWNGIHVAAVSIDGTNGTYVVNLEGNNSVGSNFNGLYQIKAGEANVTVNQ